MSRLDDLAHELWATAQLVPGECILDGVERIKQTIREFASNETHQHANDSEKARRAPIRCSHGILLSEKCAKCEIDSNDLCRPWDYGQSIGTGPTMRPTNPHPDSDRARNLEAKRHVQEI